MGEPQVLGQIKAAYREGAVQQATGPILNRLLHKTFSVAKKVRTETGIGGLAVSVSYAAVELARKIFGSLADKTGLLIGAGEMAELAVEHLKRHGVARLIVANRTLESWSGIGRTFRRHRGLSGRTGEPASYRGYRYQFHRCLGSYLNQRPGQERSAPAQTTPPVSHRHRRPPGPGPGH